MRSDVRRSSSALAASTAMVATSPVVLVFVLAALVTTVAASGCTFGGGTGAWPEVGEHNAFQPPTFNAVSTGTSHGNVRARLCVDDDADAVLAIIPWRQRELIKACSPPPPPNPPPTPADPCEWDVYSGGYNASNIPGPSGNILCGSELEPLKEVRTSAPSEVFLAFAARTSARVFSRG
jgi:hypothetical protein